MTHKATSAMSTTLRAGLLLALLTAGCTTPRTAIPAPDRSSAPDRNSLPPEYAEWDRTIEEARREGSVAVIVPIGEERRAALAEPFERAYGIRVDSWSEAGPALGPRLAAEREAGQYLWDVFVGGATTGFTTLIPMNALEPIEPACTRISAQISSGRWPARNR
jgi:hypothetical protein